MRLDSHNFSPAVLAKIVRSAARNTSFAAAEESLADEAEVKISARQVGRIAHEIGEQLKQERDQKVEAFLNKRLSPETQNAAALVVVAVDGGRMNTRSEGSGRGPGAHAPGWREDKVANLLTMIHKTHAEDPHPQLPRCFTKKKDVVELVKGVAGQGALADVVESVGEAEPELTVFEPEEDKPTPRWQPEPLVSTCQATLESSDEFGPMVASEAHRRNFSAARNRVFLGDGGAWIWALHQKYFLTFEPIVDFVHVLTYIYLAARAAAGSPAAVWARYLGWATACWQGRVDAVLAELGVILGAMSAPENPDGIQSTDPHEVIRRTIGYLTNNRHRMDYPRYRRAGLPTCSGMVESLIKRFNRRVKGTEKFWNPSQAESILQVRAALLSEDERLAKHLKSRPISAFRQYETTRTRKTG